MSDRADVVRPTTAAPVAGLGPHGEFAASLDQLGLTAAQAERATAAQFRVAVVLHTTRSDWAKQQLAGISATLAHYGASIIEVVDSEFVAEKQIRALEVMVNEHPDAVISIPVDNALTAQAHQRVTQAGIRLVLMDNAPVGLLPGKDYVSLVSADNFGNGQVAARLLSEYIPRGGSAGIVGYGADFFATNEREIGFRKSMKERRPDVVIRHGEFAEASRAGDTVIELVATHPELDGIFVVWDEPAMAVVPALHAIGRELPITTIDLGNEVALDLAQGGLIKGIGAQRPYDQGVAEALATVMALVDLEPPPWIALPGLAVSRESLLVAYQAVWHLPAPRELRRALTR